MVIDEFINNDKQAFYDLCKAHQVKYLFAFGSSVTGNFDFNKSDIDLLVEIEESDPLERGEKILALWDKLEHFFKRKVDLLTNPNIRNPYLKQSIDDSKILIDETSK
ncbi:MAG: nucleotidyltransferase domain-containing protein [Flavobacterium sp.]|nr:nucleotidyltransferase domain-containing protein [Flavobacterium sp.]